MGAPVEEILFVCPDCGRTLTLSDASDSFECDYGHRYPIVGGIPRFAGALPGGVAQTQRIFDFEHRRFETSSSTRFEPSLVDRFLEECQLDREFFKGKRVLDAGCGSGRWSYALAELGADVVGIDLTEGGLEAAYSELGDRPNVTFAQADLTRPPFAPASFDVVVSWGVLHHTPDTRRSLGMVAKLVKPGGMLYVMVYERISRIRDIGTNLVRMPLRMLSDERRYRAVRLLIVRSVRLNYLLNRFMIVSFQPPGDNPDIGTLQLGLFDAYSPRFNHTHTRPEVAGWFEDIGFRDVEVLNLSLGAVRARGVRPI